MKLPRLEKKGRLFYKYLVSYFLILLIPVIMSVFLFNRASAILSEEANRANDLLLGQVKSNLDMVMTDVQQLRYLVAYNDRMEGLLYEQTPVEPDEYYRAYQVVNDFRTYHVGSPNIIDFYVYAAGLDMVVAPTGYFTTESFLATRLRRLDTSFEEWRSLFENVDRVYYTSGRVEDRNNALVNTVQIIYPLPATNQTGRPRGWLSVHVDAEKFSQPLDDTAWSESSIVLVYHDEFGIVSSSQPASTPDLALVAESLLRSRAPSTIVLRGTQFVVVTKRSEVASWTYVSLVPLDIYADRFTDLAQFTIVAFVICMVLGGVMIYWLSIARYRPVHSLLQLLQMDPSGSVSMGRDELAVIRSSLEMTLAEDRQLRQEVKQAKPIVAQRYLQQLLKGRIADTDDSRRELEKTGIALPYPKCTLVLAEVDDSATESGGREQCIAALRDADLPAVKEIIRDIDGAIGLLLNHEDGMADWLYLTLRKIKSDVESKSNATIAIGISETRSTEDGFSLLYKHARRALDFRLVKGRDLPISYEQIRASNQSYYYPIEEETKLINSINAGDEEAAAAIVEDIFDRNFTETPLSLEMGRCLMFDLIATMIKSVNSIVMPVEDAAFWSRVRPITRLMSCNSLEQLKREIGSTLEQTCRYVRDHRTSHTEQLRNDILDHIHQHFDDPNLSPDHVAESLDRNSAYLARFFREQMNIGMSTYIKRFRVDAAKTMLLGAEITLSELASRVGFAGSNALIRAFKDIEGVTPGQFRGTVAGSADGSSKVASEPRTPPRAPLSP